MAKKEKRPVIVQAHLVAEADLDTIDEAAKLAGVTRSTLIREAAMTAAVKIIAKKSGKCPTCGAKS